MRVVAPSVEAQNTLSYLSFMPYCKGLRHIRRTKHCRSIVFTFPVREQDITKESRPTTKGYLMDYSNRQLKKLQHMFVKDMTRSQRAAAMVIQTFVRAIYSKNILEKKRVVRTVQAGLGVICARSKLIRFARSEKKSENSREVIEKKGVLATGTGERLRTRRYRGLIISDYTIILNTYRLQHTTTDSSARCACSRRRLRVTRLRSNGPRPKKTPEISEKQRLADLFRHARIVSSLIRR